MPRRARDRRVTRKATRPRTATPTRSHGHHGVESSAASCGPDASPAVGGVSVVGVVVLGVSVVRVVRVSVVGVSVVGVSVVGVSVVGVSVVGVSVVGVSVVGGSVEPLSGGTVVDRSGSVTLVGRLTSGSSESEPQAADARHATAMAAVATTFRASLVATLDRS